MTKLLDKHEDERGILTLTLNRPEQHNALSFELIEALCEALLRAKQHTDIRIIVIAGAGNTFCSGADVKYFMADAVAKQEDQRYLHELSQLLALLYGIDKLTVAKVQGPAYGGGIGLMLCCDIAIGSTACMFQFSEVRLGVIPAVISPYVVAALGERRTRHLFLRCPKVSGEEAMTHGLLQKLCAPAELDDLMQQELTELLRSAPGAVAETKALLRTLSPVHPETRHVQSWMTAHLRCSNEPQAYITTMLQKQRERR